MDVVAISTVDEDARRVLDVASAPTVKLETRLETVEDEVTAGNSEVRMELVSEIMVDDGIPGANVEFARPTEVELRAGIPEETVGLTPRLVGEDDDPGTAVELPDPVDSTEEVKGPRVVLASPEVVVEKFPELTMEDATWTVELEAKVGPADEGTGAAVDVATKVLTMSL